MNKIKWYIIISGLLQMLSVVTSSAQQAPLSIQYMFNTLTINPAFSGYHGNADITFSGQGQANGIEGAPTTMMFTADTPLNNEKIGIGVTFVNDKIGSTTSNSLFGNYSFKLISQNKNSYSSWGFLPTSLSLGIRAGVTFIKEDLQQLGTGSDPNFFENTNITIPTFGFGIYYSKNHFYAGISSPQLLKNNRDNLNLNRHYYFNTGLMLKLNRDWLFKPNGLMKYVEGAPSQLDANMIFSYRNVFDVGMGYRSASSINFLAGFTVSNHLRVVYFYNPPVENNLINAHSLLVNLRLGTGFGKYKN
jgi:type IX secretion system PorP/SprF family membrane protein